MNYQLANKLRRNLITKANRYPKQAIYYAEAASWVDLHPHSTEFADLLGDVAQHEYEQERPFLSAVVTYSPETRARQLNSDDPIHGVGLINRALKMKLDQTPEFDPLTFGHEQEKKAYTFWQNPNNLRKYKDDGLTSSEDAPYFFRVADFSKYQRLIGVPYDSTKSDHQEAYQFLRDDIGAKIRYWAESIAQDDLTVSFKNTITRLSGGRQRFKPYLWARISTKQGHRNGIYFTVDMHGGA